MFFAALQSAFPSDSHFTHRKSLRVSRLSSAVNPHSAHRFDVYADCFGFVFYLLVQCSKRPPVSPRRTRAVADIRQVLEYNHVALVSEYFVYDGVRRPVEYVTDVAKLPVT